jgi:methylated-DNA-[protein]-cysteine S-methyltransferase
MPYEYTLMPSPVGELTLVARDGKLSAILWEVERANRVRLGQLHEANDSPVLLETERQLKEYFAGTRNQFELELDFTGLAGTADHPLWRNPQLQSDRPTNR